MIYLWIGAMVVFGLLEAATVNMISIWFVGGALVALISAVLGAQLWVQCLIFFVVSGILLAFLFPFAKKYMKGKTVPTNLDRMVGKEAVITETVDNLRGTGALKIDGKEWSVRSTSGDVIEPGCVVKVVKIEGVRLYVEPVGAAVC